MSRRGWTLIELLVGIVVITVAIETGQSVAGAHGALWGTGAGLLAGLLSVGIYFSLLFWISRRDARRLQELRENYRTIYRIVAVPANPKIIILPDGAEIRLGDYGWEAGPMRHDGLIYLQGLTHEWTVVWHAGLRPGEIEKVATKPMSQYDTWHPYWASLPPLQPCPFPVIERETMTIGRPHHSHSYFVAPAFYRPRRPVTKGKDGEVV